MEEKDIKTICKAHQLQCNKTTKITGSFDKELFIVDDKYLIRTSRQPMHDEQIKINRIKDLKHVPKIVHASDQSIISSTIYYIILEYLEGSELYSVYNGLNDQNIHDIGVEISNFLFDLHSIKGEKYDIGHYTAIIPNYNNTWRSGHEKYWNYIYNSLKSIQLTNSLQQLLESSNEYINNNIASLDFESGPTLLHNDLHYKNIIIHDNALSGIIDWECSQYGEIDFDLIHLLHWSLFPPSKDFDMSDLFNIVFLTQMKNGSIPMIEKRLTIYMLEHDFIQILWSKGNRANEFLQRIKWWVSGSLEEYIRNLCRKSTDSVVRNNH